MFENLRLGLKEIVAILLVMVVVIVYLTVPDPMGKARNLANEVLETLEDLHLIRVDDPKPVLRSRNSLAANSIQPQEPRYIDPQYSLYSPAFNIIKEPSEGLLETSKDVIDEYGALNTVFYDNHDMRVSILYDLLQGDGLQPGQKAQLDHDLDRARQYTEKLAAASLENNFSADTLVSLAHQFEMEVMDETMTLDSAVLLCLNALDNASREESGRALSFLSAAYRVTRPSPQSTLEQQKVKNEGFLHTLNTWTRIVEQEESSDFLDNAMAKLNHIHTDFMLRKNEVADPVVRDLLFRVKEFQSATGNPIPFKRLSPSDLFQRLETHVSAYLAQEGDKQEGWPSRAKVVLRMEQEMDVLREEVNRALERRRESYARSEEGFSTATLHPIAIEEMAITARFEILRLRTAEKFFQVARNTKELPSIHDVTGRFMTTYPRDPFTEKAFLRIPETNVLYSLGPDLQDNQATIAFDPTNGTGSRGDIFLIQP